MASKCAKCPRPKAHPRSAYCVEHRREYNRRNRVEVSQRVEEDPGLVQKLKEHLQTGETCSTFKYYYQMTGREVSTALEWYESNHSQEQSSNSDLPRSETSSA